MRVAFLAPIKPPDHPIASGDRLIARNLLEALRRGGHEPVLASRFIAYSKRPEGLTERKRAALEEAERAIERFRPAPPDVVLAYHPYCKAPDWIGPRLAAAHRVPYVTVEAARASVDWPRWRAEAQAGMRGAALHLWLKPTDRDMLLGLLGPDAPLRPLAPFVDVEAIDAVEGAAPRGSVPRVLVVGQMRPGKKLANHLIAAEALRSVDAPFETLVLGDGPARAEVEGAVPRGTRFGGAVAPDEVVRQMRGADLLLWPGEREPIGMVYLEAAATALPVAAWADMGVPLVVEHGVSGLLAPPGDRQALAANVAALVGDGALARRLGGQGRARVVEQHSLDRAARTLHSALHDLEVR